MVTLNNRHGNADVREVHRDAATHGSRAKNPAMLDVDDRRVAWDVGDLVRGPLGEEVVPLGTGLRSGHEIGEEASLCSKSFLECAAYRGFDTLHVVLGSEETSGLAGNRLPEVREQVGIALCLLELLVTISDLRQRPAFVGSFASQGYRASFEVLDNLIDEAAHQRFTCADLIAACHHLECFRHTRDTREALGTAGTREESELDLWKPELCRLDSDPVVRTQRYLEATAERRAVNCRNNWLRAVLHGVLHLWQVWAEALSAELRDVSSCDEGATVADEHDCDGLVLCRLVHTVQQTLPDVVAERVDGRVVHDHQSNVVAHLESNRFGEFSHPVSQASTTGDDLPRAADRRSPAALQNASLGIRSLRRVASQGGAFSAVLGSAFVESCDRNKGDA